MRYQRWLCQRMAFQEIKIKAERCAHLANPIGCCPLRESLCSRRKRRPNHLLRQVDENKGVMVGTIRQIKRETFGRVDIEFHRDKKKKRKKKRNERERKKRRERLRERERKKKGERD